MTDPLYINDDDQYSRLRLIGWWRQERLAAAKVLVVGAGAIGNEVLKNLALIGIGQVYVLDFDRIELSNLTRSVLFRRKDCGRSKAEVAAEAMQDLNPDTRVTPWQANVITDIGLGLFREVDVVIGCLDNREARLWVNRQCWKVGTPWIDGGIQEINGVVKTFLPGQGACYECAMTENDYRLINLRYSCPLLRHDEILAGKVPTAPTIASIVGGWQVQEALKLLHGLPVDGGAAHVYNGVSNQTYTTRYQLKEDCLSHETYEHIVALPLSATRHTAADLFAQVRAAAPVGTHHSPSDVLGISAPSADLKDATPGSRQLSEREEYKPNDDRLELVLDRDLVVALVCSCGEQRSVFRARADVKLSEAKCGCGETMHPQLEHVIVEGSPLAEKTLRELGIPPYDIVRVTNAGEEGLYLLDVDREEVMG